MKAIDDSALRSTASPNAHTVTLVFAAAWFAWAVAPAQTPRYADVTATHLPSMLAGPCMDAAAGDADGDGDLDIALAMEFAPNKLLLNDGAGMFADASDRLPRTVHDSEDVAFADFDGDGDLDLVFVSEDDRADELYLNDGTGSYMDVSIRLQRADVSNALAVLDLNGDGAPDLLFGNIGFNRVLINDGTAHFVDATRGRWPQEEESRTQDLELADVDGDGDWDVVVGNEGQNALFLNDGGRLVDATRSRLPRRTDETREIKAADIDADGDLDLVVANVDFLLDEGSQDYLLLNDGTGAFTPAGSGQFPEGARNNFTVQVVDLDGDGDLDALAPSTVFPVTTRLGSVGDYLVLLNDGSGRFSIAPPGSVLPLSASGNGFDVEVADFDRDGATDLFLCNRASAREPELAPHSGGLQRLLLGASARN